MHSTQRKFLYSGSNMGITNHAAALIIAEAYRAIADRGLFSFVLAGGNSPRLLYERLSQGVTTGLMEYYGLTAPARSFGCSQSVHFLPPNTWLFQGDERCGPVNHPDSNFRMIKETLLRHCDIAKDHFFRMASENADTEGAARTYEAAIRFFCFNEMNLPPQNYPEFDLILLGLGEDGHTASLFSDNDAALHERKRWVIAVDAPKAKPPGMRLTLTIPVINHARNVLFFTTGSQKGELAKKIFLEEEKEVPASLIKAENGNLFWFTAQL